MQLPHSSLLLAAALSISTITSSSASYVHPEVAPSDLVRDFGIRSSEPAGFEDSKHNGFPSSYLNALGQLSAEPKAEAEATAHSIKIYDEFSHRIILARRSAEPEPAVEVGPIYKSLFKFNNNNNNNKFNYVYYPGQGLQDPINSGLFNFKEKRSAEPEPDVEHVDPGPVGHIGHGLFKQLMSYRFFA